MASIYDYLQQLMSRAQPRSDLITPGTTGSLENARPFTYMGRVFNAGDQPTLYDVLTKPQNESPDAEGYAGAGLASGAVAGAMRPSRMAGRMSSRPDFAKNIDFVANSHPFVDLFRDIFRLPGSKEDPIERLIEYLSYSTPDELMNIAKDAGVKSTATAHNAASAIKLLDQLGKLPSSNESALRAYASRNFNEAEAINSTLKRAAIESKEALAKAQGNR